MHSLDSNHTVLTMSKDHEPVLSVSSGETIAIETLDCFSNALLSEHDLLSSVGWDQVNPATGPISVHGAAVGDTLRVDILDIEVETEGTMATHPDLGALPGAVEERTKKIPVIDGQVHFDEQYSFPFEPMVGVIGTAPKGDEIATGTPADHGGNMDTIKITTGSTLYLPVEAPGGLLAIGDVHAAMADGEVASCGLEIGARVVVRVSVVPGRPLPLPFLVTSTEAITIASREGLMEAVQEATRMMRDFLVERTYLTNSEALMLLSLQGTAGISQVVDPLKTARMEVPHQLFEAYDLSEAIQV